MVQDNGEDIIELTQVIPDDTLEDDGQDIIELTDIEPGEIENDAGVDTGDHGIIDLSEPILDDPETDSANQDSPLSAEMTAEDTDTTAQPAPVSDISQEALQVALERVIEKKFSETIEKILFEVMEKVIQKEIADIKASLQKDLDEIGNA